MTAFLDDRPLAGGIGSKSTVAEIVAAAQRSLAGSGRLLVGLRRDGNDVGPEELDALMAAPIDEQTRLDLVSDQPAHVVLDSLEQARDCLAQSFELVQEASDKMASGACAEALGTLTTCIRAWGQVHETVVKGGQLLGIKFSELAIHERSVDSWLAGLVERLREVKSAIEVNDLVLLADMLRYELDETLQDWEAFIGGFIDHIRQNNAAVSTPNVPVP